eukprot:2496322-Amphidinium_carterae.1
MVHNLCQSTRSSNTPSTRRSQGTICDTVGLCLHKVQSADNKEVAGSHSLDVCGDIDWALYGNSDNKE